MLNAFMRIMATVEKQKSVSLSTLRKPASHSANLAPVLKKVSANIAILGKYVLVSKVLDIVLEETGVGTGILSSMRIRIVLRVTLKSKSSTITSILIFSCRATQCLVLSVRLSVRLSVCLSVPNFVPDFVPNFCPRFYSQTTRGFVQSKSPAGLSVYKCTEAGINSCITV